MFPPAATGIPPPAPEPPPDNPDSLRHSNSTTPSPHRRPPHPACAAKSCIPPPAPSPARTALKEMGNSAHAPAPSAPSPASIPRTSHVHRPPWRRPYYLYIRMRHTSRRTAARTASPTYSTPTPAPPPRKPALRQFPPHPPHPAPPPPISRPLKPRSSRYRFFFSTFLTRI